MPRHQQTISRPAHVSGVGYLTGADVRLRFLPAAADHGIAFLRVDCPDSVPIPARAEFTVPRARRTTLAHLGTNVEMIEHVMAALAGLQIDNCLIEINAPETPGCDGSSLLFADALYDAGLVDLGVPRNCLAIQSEVVAHSPDGQSRIAAHRTVHPGWRIGYTLNYGLDSPIPAQGFSVVITPESFLKELAPARTFVLEEEVAALQAQGYGTRTTAHDLLIFGPKGIIDNTLRYEDECARHKVLDCLGDLALIGCDLAGYLAAYRSGHRLNVEIVRKLQEVHGGRATPDLRKAG